MTNENEYIYGRNPVYEALRSNNIYFEKIYIRFSAKGRQIDKIIDLSRKKKVPISLLDNQSYSQLEKKIGKQTETQGVIALISPIQFKNLDELVDLAFARNSMPILLFLDKIQDPQNLGAIARTSECAGIDGLILTKKETSPINSTVIKASSGGILNVLVSKVNSSSQAIEFLKSKGFWIIGTAPSSGKYYTEENYNVPVVIIIGSEGKGLSPSVVKHCDSLVEIPVFGKVESLNASVSAGIILYEILRQRGSFASK